MREFRTAYIAPCRTGKSRKPGYVPTRVDVAVCQVPTGTAEAVLHPFPKPSTDIAGLGGIGRFHEFNLEAGSFGLVLGKSLKLAEGPSMQPRPYPDPGLDASTDVGKILHAEGGSPRPNGLGDDGLAGYMVDVADMPLLLAGDGLELPFGGTATVGLETTPGGEVSIPVMPKLSPSEYLAGAGGGEVVFPDIQTRRKIARKRRGVRKVEHQVQIPNSLAGDEPGFLGDARGQKRLLARSADKPHLGPAPGGEEGKGLPLDQVGSVIKADGSGREGDRRDRLVIGNAFIGSERLLGIRHPAYGLTDHLAASSFHFAIFSLIWMDVKHPFLPALKCQFVSRIPGGDPEKDGITWTIR